MRQLLMIPAVGAALLLARPGEVSAQVPPEHKTNRSISNAVSEDDRIQLRTFHAIFFFDSNHPSHRVALNNEGKLKYIFENFSAEARRDANDNAVFVPFNWKVTPVVKANVLDGAQATKAELDGAINRLRSDDVNGVKPGDVVFFFGEAEGTSLGGRVVLELNNGDRIDRESLVRALEFPDARGVRQTYLTVVITDNCQTDPFGGRGRRSTPFRSTIWRALYFGHSGTVDITSSTPGSSAFAVEGYSIFLEAFRNMFDSDKVPREELLDEKMFVAWEKFFPRLQAETQEIYDNYLRRYYVYDAGGLPTEMTTAEFDRLTDADAKKLIREMRETRARGDHLPRWKTTELKVNEGPRR